MINEIVRDMHLAGNSYKISSIVEEFIFNCVKEYFCDYKVSYQENYALVDSKNQSKNLFTTKFKHKPRKRRFDIVIEKNNKKHIIEIKHQTGGGTAIDSVGIYLEDMEKLKEYTGTGNPVSIMVLDFLPYGIYKNGTWDKKETFVEMASTQTRFNEFAEDQDVLVLLSDTYDKELFEMFFDAVKERL